ncbi:MAG: FIST N-terminal domain-containing protein [Alphaproteobacteria bacterium]
MQQFGFGHASGDDWRAATQGCLDQLDPPPGANLGFVYVTDALAGELGNITALLAQETGIVDWVGTTGVGICATGQEYFDVPAVAVMAGGFPAESFALFDRFGDDRAGFLAGLGPWAGRGEAHFAVVHADPRDHNIMAQVPALADAAGCFLVGGLASSRGTYAHVAGALTEGALSGVMFSDAVPVATALTQGCSPIGPVHDVTHCQGNIAIEIDGRAAVDVLKDEIGPDLAQNLAQIGGIIFVAFPVAGSDRADYMVRNLVGLDEERGILAIGAPLEDGQKIMFCRRDGETARADLARMLSDLKRRATTPPKGAVYFTCLGRGPNMFGAQSAELAAIQDQLGDVPLVGFFCNGEISHDRVYSYTGVLSLFL